MRVKSCVLGLVLCIALGIVASVGHAYAQTPTIVLRGATVSFTTWWPAATCESGAATAGAWHYGTAATNAPTPTCKNSSPTTSIAATLAFDDSATEAIYRDELLPSDWAAPMGLTFVWYTSATTGNVLWQAATLCTAVGASTDETAYTYNTANTVSDAAQGTTLRLNTATIASLTTTGCTAGSLLHLKVFRDPSNAGDTISATASLVGVTFNSRRTLS